ncbi:hypothetical protein [Nannocystis pusilla]|uniref:Uncharacterized protein n=1 Tax=Nannocystis pusilla TaxID=889268 RepID=A0ABS7TP21_9BACT|nr:hypothetical protein [Nannocystis pusilla]MBZ5709965.1 hypothetical protein [Nannocystis pusilla]
MSEIPPEAADLLFPATLDLYYSWNHTWGVDENISEILRAFPQFSSSRDRLVEEAKRLLRNRRRPFNGEFHLFREEEDAMIGRVRRAQAVDLAHVVRWTGSNTPWGGEAEPGDGS